MPSHQSFLVGLVMVIYASVGLSYLWERNWPWAITWLCYAGANIGLIWASYRGQ